MRGYLDAVEDADDSRIQQILIDPQDQKSGIGCDYHPSVATHALMGKVLAAGIKAAMGW